MRRPTRRLGLAVAAAGLLLGLLWRLAPPRSGDVPVEPPLARAAPSTWSPQALAVPASASGTQTLGGQVLGPEGPVAGALVVALPTPSAAWRSLPVPPERPREVCVRDPATEQLLDEVEAHRGDARPLAHATTDARGHFRLEGLGPDPVVLWAEKGLLLGVHGGLSPGAHEARVQVRPGAWLSSEVLDEAGAPLAGVRITALVRAAGRALETVTGEDGRFVLGPLPDRQEPLVLSKPGFLAASRDLREPTRGAPRLFAPHRLSGRVEDERGPVAGATVQLGSAPAGEATTTDAQGRFALEGLCAGRRILEARQAGRAARRWVDVAPGREDPPVDLLLGPAVRLSGRVTGPSGQTLPEAEVSALGEEPPLLLQTKADAQGRFLLEPLVPGRYAVMARAPHHAPGRVPARLYDAPQEVDLALKDAEPLEGRVVDERDTPVPGVRLRLTSVRGPELERTLATSEADGRFLLEAPRAGPWRVVAGHSDFLPENVTLSAPVRDARVVLRRGASLEARVVDEEGQPVVNAEVSLALVSGEARAQQGRTDAEGKAVFSSLPPGDYTLQACSADRSRQTSELTLAAGEPRPVRVSLPRGGRLTGQVVDAQGQPLEGASFRLNLLPSRPDACRASADLQAGAEGHFALPLAEGTWTLSAATRDLVLDAEASRGVEISGNTTSVQVLGGADVSRVHLVLRPPRNVLRGRVVHGDGRPVSRFQLNGREVRDAEGRFVQALGRGNRFLSIEAPGLAPFSKVLAYAPRQDIDLGEVVLEPLGRVEGTVVDALSAVPIAGAQVKVQGRPPLPSRQELLTYTRADGHFTLEGIRPTDKALGIVHPLHPPLEVAFTPGQPVRVKLEPGATLEGRVEADGVPVDGGSVQLRTPEGAVVASTESWKGRYILELIRAGRYTVRVQGTRREGPPVLYPLRSVELAVGERKTLDFSHSQAGVSVEVLVPERNIEVYLMPGEFPLLGPRQGLYGKLLEGVLGKRVNDTARRFPALPGGTYTLVAIRADEATDVHREVVELPDEGDLSFSLMPFWTHYEE